MQNPPQRPVRIPPQGVPSGTKVVLPADEAAAFLPRRAPQTDLPATPTIEPEAPTNWNWLLYTLLFGGFALAVLLPGVAAWILAALPAPVQTNIVPKVVPNLAPRTLAFFLAVLGGWGFVVYTWGCSVLCEQKGISRLWALLAFPGLLSFILLPVAGTPALCLLMVLGAGGFAVPMLIPADSILMGATTPTNLLNRLARHTAWVWMLGLFVGGSWAYGNSFQGGMTLDNKYIIEEYFHQVSKMVPGDKIYDTQSMVPIFFTNDYWWPKGISGLYRPIAVMSYWLNYKVNNMMGNDPLDPFQYHVVNLILHWLTACLGFVLILQLTRRRWVAFFTCLLFITHPIATESVSNIIGRSDIFAAIATFACLVLYIRSVRPTLPQPAVDEADPLPERGPWMTLLWQTPWLLAILVVLTFGLFAKESAIAVGGIIVAYDIIYRLTLEDLRRAVPSLLLFSLIAAAGSVKALWIGQFGALGLSEGLTPVLVIALLGSLVVAAGLVVAWVFWVMNKPTSFSEFASPWAKYFIPYLTFIPPVLLWLYARNYVFYNASPPETPFLDNPIRGLGFVEARICACNVFLRLIGLLVWPLHLSCDYSFNQITMIGGHLTGGQTTLGIVGVLVLLLVLALIGYTFRSHKVICFLLCFYLIAYLPTSNFLIIIGSIMAERFLYLPLLGFVACVVLFAEMIGKRIHASFERPEGDKKDGESYSLAAFSRSSAVWTLLGVLALIYGERGRFRNDDWFSDVSLWTSAAEISPVSFRSYQSKAFALYEVYMSRLTSGAYAKNAQMQNDDIDACWQTAVQAKPIVDVLPPEQNSARLYLHLGMYYSAKGGVVGHFSPNGVVQPGDPGEDWFRKAEKVLQDGVVIDRTFNGVNRKKELARKKLPPADIADVGLPPVYMSLGQAYGRLGEWKKALEAFKYDQHLEPLDADPYAQIANCYANTGRFEDEAVTLLEILLLDSRRQDVWQPLANALAQINRSGSPAVITTDGHPQLQGQIPEVRSVICSTYQQLFTIFTLSKRSAIAAQFRNAAINQWHFSPELFEGLVTDPDAEAPVPPQADGEDAN
jgi:tetratricopeptide (TPR) repeat protein